MNNELLFDILSEPTAPFRESHVVRTIERLLSEAGVPHFQDPVGNILIGIGSKKEYAALLASRSSEPVRVFIAHMDHPGFHGVRWRSNRALEVKWLGGTPRKFLNGARVWLADSGAFRAEGTLKEAKLLPNGAALQSGVIRFKTAVDGMKASELFGGFKFRAPVWRKGDLLYTKAADDLVGATVLSSLGMELAKTRRRSKGSKGPAFIGLLTRAEEVGFIGAIGHFELGWIQKAKRPVLCVSLETSRALPGAEIGKGPVVRLGDRATTFHPGSLNIFSGLARKVLPDRHQRRIMDGGTCEGTVSTAYGFPTVGISIPLGNYHNQSFEGGPDSRGPLGPAPEFVHLKDINGMRALCKALLTANLPWQDPWGEKLKQFRASKAHYRGLLKLR